MTWSLQRFSPRKQGNGEVDIFQGLRQEMDRLFDDFTRGTGWHFEAGLPTAPSMRLDVAETDDAFSVTAELPGVDEKDVEVMLADDMLTIRGEKKQEREEKKKDFHLQERSWGAFERRIMVPFHADPAKVAATFKQGVLTVTVPKPAEARTQIKKIEVKPGA